MRYVKIQPAKEAFYEQYRQGGMVTVSAEVSMDMDTPVSIYYKLVGEEKGFILESATINQQFGRFSFIGMEPLATVCVYKDKLVVSEDDGVLEIKGSPVEALKAYTKKFQSAEMDAALPLLKGGLVGFFNYEVVATFDRIRGLDITADQVLGEFMISRIMIVVDHFKNTAKIVHLMPANTHESVDAAYAEAVGKIQSVYEKLQQPVQRKTKNEERHLPALDFKHLHEDVPKEFLAMIRKGKEYITAGDAFQIVLSRPFQCEITQPGFLFYRRLRQVNPSAYMFYLNFGEKKLVGASPEMLVKISGDQVFTYPIAGSRRRGKTPEEDLALAQELLQDEKECAEHAMLVDLSRNDVGRISDPGTVRVEKMMQVEKFSHIMHIVSEVSGKIRQGYEALDVLKACFPAGTLSGAPKLRAMEIIQELEGSSRNAYAGTVGYIDFNGNMDMCITIRTMQIQGTTAVVQAGAGIVADSVATTEYKEILQKAGALFQVIEEVENGDFADR